ncbi:sensor histidine kinase [Streptomyces sp. NPDC044984]|uniref:sensor histidine kinase n=1 Tax=Streptomyces sp. NPDC044984 TaxID=3154335 RepID=UPI0033FE8585
MTAIRSLAGHGIPPAVTDTGLAVLVFGSCLALPQIVPADGQALRTPDTWWFGLVLLTAVGFAAHRRTPLASLLITASAATVLQGLSYVPQVVGEQGMSIGPTNLAVATAVFLTAVRRGPWLTTAVAGVFIPLYSLTEALLAPLGHRLAALATVAVLLLAAWAFGRLAKARAAIRDEAVERAAALEREHTANARAAVMHERARIARELHDIVAHNVSLMVVQTIAADRVQDRTPEKAHELHAAVEQTGRDTVTELRRLLDVLRTEEEEDRADPSKEPPQPTVDAVPSLVDSVRATGLDVDFAVSGRPLALPAGTHLTAYRIVQEALTNTLKHAGPTLVRVHLAWSDQPARLTIRICDDGPAHPAPVARNAAVVGHGTGHGLVGMRERIGAVGGTLHTGPRPGGGYCVHAVLDLT